MKEIGRVLACVLLAATFAKNVLATSAANMKFSKGRSNEIVRSDITKLRKISEPPNPIVVYPRNLSNGMFKSEDDQDAGMLEESRTFGGMKRLQFMLMPMMYKMGVMMTMLMILTAISAKGLFVGLILLVLKLSTFLAKFHSGWHGGHSQQPIHVHVHNGLPHIHPHMYHGWEMAGDPGDDDHYYYKG